MLFGFTMVEACLESNVGLQTIAVGLRDGVWKMYFAQIYSDTRGEFRNVLAEAQVSRVCTADSCFPDAKFMHYL